MVNRLINIRLVFILLCTGLQYLQNKMQTDGEIKIALKVDDDQVVLYKLNTSESLEKIVNDICRTYKKNNVNNKYGLLFSQTPNEQSNLVNKYVTEENLSQIKDGYFIDLIGSISYVLEWVFISVNTDVSQEKLSRLPNLCNDPGVITEMIKAGYHNKIPLMTMKYKDECLLICLKSLTNIINNNVKPSTVNVKFIDFLINLVKDANTPNSVLTHSLQLLNLIMDKNFECLCITNMISVNDVIPYCWMSDYPELQLQTIKFFNNMILKLDQSKDKFIEELKLPKNRTIINKYVTENAEKNIRLLHVLCVYQSYLLSTYQPLLTKRINYNNYYLNVMELRSEYNSNRRETLVDFEEKEHRSRVNTLNSDSSENILRTSRENSTDGQTDYTDVNIDNAIDYCRLEPIVLSKLTSQCIEFYKSRYEKNYNISALETKYKPGFFRVCDQIATMLCEILYINTVPDKDATLYIPLIFKEDKFIFFEELFCRAVWLLAKTRREMKAKVEEDHQKVLAVLKEQIILALNSRPKKYKDLSDRLKKISYQNVFDKWERERVVQWNNLLQNTPALQEVKELLIPNIKDLIKEQRLKVLTRGEFFCRVPEKKGKQLYWKIFLTKNHKKISFGNFDPDTKKYTSAKKEISINKVQHIAVGKASKHVKENKVRRLDQVPKCFSLLFDDETSLDFLAINELTAQYWIDGFHLLLGKPADSKSYNSELETLLTMELNIHLIELQNLPISRTPPPLPPLPGEYVVKPVVPEKSDFLRQSIIRRRTLNLL